MSKKLSDDINNKLIINLRNQATPCVLFMKEGEARDAY